MLKGFEGYYQPDFDKLWNDAIFVFDTNVLLDLYRSSPKSRKEMIDILEGLDGRIWIPHQFFHEYHNHKATIYDSINNDYETWGKNLQESRKSAINGLQEELGKIKNRTGLEIDPRNEQVASIFEDILRDLAESKEQHVSSLVEDLLEEKIVQLFAGNYGESFDDSCMENIREIAKERHKKGMPPGSEKDYKKDNSNTDGDLIGWLQTIKYAECKQTPIILVTNDKDWYLYHKGKCKGPHPKLLQEMHDKANVSCYIYKIPQFMKNAREFLASRVSKEALEEAENREKYVAEQESEKEHREPVRKALSKTTTNILEKSAFSILRSYQQERLENVIKAFTPTVSELNNWIVKDFQDKQQLLADIEAKPILEAQQREFDAMMKPFLEAQERAIDDMLKNLPF